MSRSRSRLLRWLSRISIRLLAFNLLLVFLPVAGVLFLDTYEQHLLRAQEGTMVQEGRLLAAAIEATGQLQAEDAQRILVHLRQRHEARLRVVDREGRLLADSASLGPRREPEQQPQAESTAAESDSSPSSSTLYRLGSLPFRIMRKLSQPPSGSVADSYDGSQQLLGSEIQSALAGRYGAKTRIVPGDSPTVTLYCALPVHAGGKRGAVLVSQSTSRILRTLYAVRLDIFKVFLTSIAAAVLLTLVVSTTIARPLSRLRRQAEVILDGKGRLRGSFQPSRRRDEIGELERALAELTRRLEVHIEATEAFASDVSHEFKNPLASIRTATDMALDVEEPDERRRFLAMIQGEVARMERLLTGVREISRIDAHLDQEERGNVRLDDLLPAIVEGFRLRFSSGPTFILAVAASDLVVNASADRLTQVFENILDNAVSFSPPGSKVTVTVSAEQNQAVLAVSDEGPGIPAEHRERIFNRFFSYRSGQRDSADHTGLGLAIVRAIVEGYGGSVRAGTPSSGNGTTITVSLPLISEEP